MGTREIICCPQTMPQITTGQQIMIRVSRTSGVPCGNLWHRLRTTNYFSSLKDLWGALWEFVASFEDNKLFLESQGPLGCPVVICGIVLGQQIIRRVSRSSGVPCGNFWHRLRTTNRWSSLKNLLGALCDVVAPFEDNKLLVESQGALGFPE